MPRFPVAIAVGLVLGTALPARGQALPTEPVSLGDGRVVVGAELSATAASVDNGFFNYTDYEYSALRNVRISVTAEVRASERLQVLGELRVDHGDLLQPFAFYARIRPWPARPFDVQVGRIPPTFGAFGRGTYGSANMLIGTPLAYQYLTSLRPDALPATTDDLVRMRGRGWLSNFPLGNTAPDRGLPLINSFRWDTGAQVHGTTGLLDWTASVTTGSLSNPRLGDDNGGRQFAGRARIRPGAALAFGLSASRGAFLSRSLTPVVGESRVDDAVQRAWAVDAEYSAGRFLGRGEVIWSEWRLPLPAAAAWLRLDATAMLAEARYRILPGLHVATRVERLGFNRIAATAGAVRWEAPVRRLEIGAGYSIIRNVMVKGAWQRNYRDGGRVLRESLATAQLVYWF